MLTERVEDLRHAVRRVRALTPFDIDAWAFLPDHMHAVSTLPEDDSEVSRRWRENVINCRILPTPL